MSIRMWAVDKYIKFHCIKPILNGEIDPDYYADMADGLMEELTIQDAKYRLKYLFGVEE